MIKSYHVTPRPQGGWQVKKSGGKRATAVATTQSGAIKIATEKAKKQGCELFVHNQKGQIRERSSYGNDPYPPKG